MMRDNEAMPAREAMRGNRGASQTVANIRLGGIRGEIDGFLMNIPFHVWYNGQAIQKQDVPTPLETAGDVSQCVGGASTMNNHSYIPDSAQPHTVAIPISKGYIAIVDECDADLAQYRWYALERGHTVYAQRKDYQNGGMVYMHREILERKLDRKLVTRNICDHADRNGLNNTRDNLRLATPSQNVINSRKINNGLLRGVHRASARKWSAAIRVNGISTRLGFYDSPEEAHAAYLEASAVHHGEFASGDNGELEQPTPPRRIALHREKLAAALRAKRGNIRQDDVRAILEHHIAKGMYSRLENGKCGYLNQDAYMAICNWLECHPTEFTPDAPKFAFDDLIGLAS